MSFVLLVFGVLGLWVGTQFAVGGAVRPVTGAGPLPYVAPVCRTWGERMKLDRTDATSVIAIGCGALVAGGLTGLVAEGESQDRYEVRGEQVEHVIDPSEVSTTMKGATVRITQSKGEDVRVVVEHSGVESGEAQGVRIIRSDDASVPGDLQPLLYVDGVRMEGDRESVLSGIDREHIDRIEVVKGEAAIRLFGDQATGGVIQIFLKDIGAAHPGG